MTAINLLEFLFDLKGHESLFVDKLFLNVVFLENLNIKGHKRAQKPCLTL